MNSKHFVSLLLVVAMHVFYACGDTQFSGGGQRVPDSIDEPTPKSIDINKEPTPGVVDPIDPDVVDPTPAPVEIPTPDLTAVPTAPPPTDIEFGADEAFHIGDGAFGGSSCLQDLQLSPLSGTKYLFDFEVVEDNTEITINMNTVCGVDYDLDNIAGVQNNSTLAMLLTYPIKVSDTTIAFSKQTLNAGTYSVVVQSIKSGFDFDDFIVGKIHVKANKKILPGSIRTE